ncbi:MAG: AzlD domain-containing protein [Pseudomonadota bacterium]
MADSLMISGVAPGDLAIYGAIVMMALVIYAMRIAGGELMSLFSMTPRLKAVLTAMATAVLIAIVAAECARGGLRPSSAVLVAAAGMVITKSPLFSIALAMTLAGLARWLMG